MEGNSMKLKLEIKMNNAAFQDDPAAEAATILRKAADRIAEGWTDGPLIDTNGNTVGHYEVIDR